MDEATFTEYLKRSGRKTQVIDKYIKLITDFESNFDDITTIISTNGLGDLPLLNFTHDGWEIEFFPIPKDPQYRGKSGIRPIGMQTPEAVMVKSKKIIKQAISKKATRYGKMNKPYLIAVNDISFLTDEEDRIEALFGTEQFHILLSGQEQLFAGSNRKPDGFWVGPNGIQNTRVSAVMIADQILPWSIHNQSVRIYHNPWAQIPLQGLINRLPQATACENQMQYEVGIHPHELLKIPLDWIRKNYSE